MKVLKEIIDNWGYVNSTQLKELEKYFPSMELIIKWGWMPREARPASEVEEVIAHVEGMNKDYAREVFIKSTHMDLLREALGVHHPTPLS